MLSKTNRTIIFLSATAALCALCGRLAAQAPIIIQHPPPAALPAPQPSRADLIKKAKSGDYSGVAIDIIASAHATGAIPMLQKRFLQTNDPGMKAHLASVLVRLGATDETYWDYLLNYATKAIESDIPGIDQYDENGKVLDTPSPAFAYWAATRHLSIEQVGEQALHNEGAVLFLALTGDSRGVPVLQEGLQSPDPLIEMYSAAGLAQAKDDRAASLIIDACKRAPKDLQKGLAMQLIYFDDPDSKSAIDRYLPKDMAKTLRASHVSGEVPFP